ncbi:MAG: alpha-galactosidase [Blastocatellia bacterium]|jgi:predicted O-methyltransferase YrrM|nr:alpha-galactosidase [Blastocatellia bacterium]
MYLDSLEPSFAQVGYGDLGRHGALGYGSLPVLVKGQPYERSLSTHPPAHLRFKLDGRFASFSCQVALNDDVNPGLSHADFVVLADGQEVAFAAYVVAGEAPRTLRAKINGAKELSLLVRTSRWENCHAVWLDPQVDEGDAPDEANSGTLLDCLQRTEIELPSVMPRAERCIATIVSPGFESLLDDMLGSLVAYGCCPDALLVVFGVEADEACRRVAEKYGAILLPCTKRANINSTVKSAMYSAARVIQAEQFICLDADMLVLGDLRPVFATLEACPEGTLLACREANSNVVNNLDHALCSVYGGHSSDIHRLLGSHNGEGAYPLVVNDGLFAGGRAALLALDGVIRSWTNAPSWVDERGDIWWRNQLVFNLALAHLHCGVELSPIYNVQLNSQNVEMSWADGRLQAHWFGHRARVLHFNGLGRYKYPEHRNLFSKIDKPLVGNKEGDGYSLFVDALRAWVGRYGLDALAWSFYGTTEATAARVRDPSTLPLLALLHYLLRSNGCCRVLETGTARGVSAACIASAVAHREGGRVVTFDPASFPERGELWSLLPARMRECLDARETDSLEGMRACLKAGESFDAALLDSLHVEEHIWQEFQLASQLVCPGGLILIHDVCVALGTVEAALKRIEQAGYGVTRLWTAECGVREDDHLGLAVIENRLRSSPENQREDVRQNSSIA